MIVEPPTAANLTPAPIPASTCIDTSAKDCDTVEQIDAKLLHMQEQWAQSRSGPFPESVLNTIAYLRGELEQQALPSALAPAHTPNSSPIATFESDTATPAQTPSQTPTAAPTPTSSIPVPVPILAPALPSAPTTTTDSRTAITAEATTAITAATAEQHNMMRSNSGESKESEGTGREEIGELENTESIAKGEGETERRIDEETMVKHEDMKEVRAQTGEDDMTRRQPTPFDWAMDVDKSMSPVPAMFPERAAAEHVDLLPSVSNQPTHIPTDNPAPAMHISATSRQPAPTAELVPVDAPRPKPIVHSLRDISGLRSNARNPWSSMCHRRLPSHPPRDFSSLCSGTTNPWGGLRHHNHRSYPQHLHRRYLASDPHSHSNLNPWHPHHSISPPQNPFNPHSHSYPLLRTEPPANIFQIIRHPIGISETKPKITKTISNNTASPAGSQEQFRTTCCTCGNIIPSHGQDRDSQRSSDMSRRRFKRGFDIRFGRRSNRRFSRMFSVW